MTDPLTITSDPQMKESEFVLLKDAVEVARGTVDSLYDFVFDFPLEQYDEIAVHPKNFHFLQAMGDPIDGAWE